MGQYLSSGSNNFSSDIRNDVENVRQVPDKNNEFKTKMVEDEIQKNRNRNLEVDDWTMYDGQYPRLGPIILKNGADNSTSVNVDLN